MPAASVDSVFLPADIADMPLPPKVQEIFAKIDDATLREHLAATVRLALAALAEVGRIHLPQDDFEDRQQGVDDKHEDLAPYVLQAVRSINRLLAYLMQTYPVPVATGNQSDDSFDMEFDLMDGPTGDAKGLTKTADVAKASLTPSEAVADAAHAYGAMLRSRMVAFGERLQHATAQADSWPLLAELDDNKHRLSKAVQGVLFGVLSLFASEVRREEIYPAYRSAVGESVQLRSALTDLSFHVNKFNAAIAKSTAGAAVPLVVAVADRLTRFSARPEYRTLRAEDKKAVIDFRRTLYEMRQRTDGISMGPLKFAVEGFSKFLESMQQINHREVLVLHDRQRLQEALDKLEQAQDMADEHAACEELDTVIVALGAVQGRNPELDDARRNYMPVSADGVAAELIKWRALVESTAGMVG